MRSAWLEVDLGAYRRNLEGVMAHTGRPALAVVKANAYGHGLVRLAREAMDAGCIGVGVALPEEGEALREAGHAGRILVLGLALEEQAELVARCGLEATVSRPELVAALSREAVRQGVEVPIHVKVDTGMTRVGVEPGQALAFCRSVRAMPGLRLAGLSTHFACADQEDLSYTEAQWRLFEPLAREVRTWDDPPVLHACNSPASLWFPPAWLDWVRPGIMTYGVPPAPLPLPFPLHPVATLKARVVQVREIPAGRSVSYGATWTSDAPARLALVTLGYADGLPWALANKGHALLRGQRVPIRGRVCMDQTILDVTALPPVEVGEEAVFLGRQGEAEITAAEIAAQAGSLTYEVLTGLAARLPRLYRPAGG